MSKLNLSQAGRLQHDFAGDDGTMTDQCAARLLRLTWVYIEYVRGGLDREMAGVYLRHIRQLEEDLKRVERGGEAATGLPAIPIRLH